jgi:glucokinase
VYRNHVFGVDIGGTFIKMGLLDISGIIIDKWVIPTRTESDGAYILGDVAAAVRRVMAQRGLAGKDVEGIGLCIPGPVSGDGMVYKCLNLGWGVFNAEEELERLSGFRVKAGNDGNVAALGEMWLGAGRGCMNIVMLTLGTGIGGGILAGGKIIAGAHGAAGEIGHININRDESEPCVCGNKGCLEQYCSAKGLVNEARKYLRGPGTQAGVKTALKDTGGLSAQMIFDAAKAGDPVAAEIVERFGDTLGRGLSIIACVADPEVFIIGGGMSQAGSLLTDTVRKHFRKYAFHAGINTEFRLATLGNSSGICGCVRLLLQ